MIVYVRRRKLRLYVASVSTLTLLVLCLQVFAGVHR